MTNDDKTRLQSPHVTEVEKSFCLEKCKKTIIADDIKKNPRCYKFCDLTDDAIELNKCLKKFYGHKVLEERSKVLLKMHKEDSSDQEDDQEDEQLIRTGIPDYQ